MRKAFALALIATVVAVVAFLMKPDDEKCRSEALEAFREGKLRMVSMPQNVNSELLAETLEKNFMESLVVEDRFLFKEIFLQKELRTKIGWGAFGMVSVDVE